MTRQTDPFAVDLDAFHETSQTRRAASLIELTVEQKAPVTLLLGEAGVGKTTLVHKLVSAGMPGLRIGVARAVPEGEGSDDPFPRFLAAFERSAAPAPADGARARFLRSLVEAHEAGQTSLLVLDDAHLEAEETLWTLQMLLTVGSAGSASPLILLLVGEPGLAQRLREPRLARLAERVEATVSMGPMSRKETAGFLKRRLAAAGVSEALFRDDAVKLIHERAGGLPAKALDAASRCLAATSRGGPNELDAAAVGAVLDGEHALPEPAPGLDRTPVTPAGADAGIVARPSRAPHGAPPPPAGPGGDPPGDPDEFLGLKPAPKREPGGGTPFGGRSAAAEVDAPPLQLVDRAGAAGVAGEPDEDDEAEEHLADHPGRRRAGWALGGAALVAGAAAAAFLLLDRPAVEGPSPGVIVPSLHALGPESGPTTADALYRRAVEVGQTDTEGAAIAYARAALRGHARAAYYLGQLYETGDGVPLDRGLARIWYDRAANSLDVARRRLEALPPPAPREPVRSPPVPLYSGRMESGEVELVWNPPAGAEEFVVEFAREPDGDVLVSETVEASAARLTPPEGADYWRVAASEGSAPPTQWLPVDAGRWAAG